MASRIERLWGVVRESIGQQTPRQLKPSERLLALCKHCRNVHFIAGDIMSEMIGEVLAMERFRVRNVIVSVTQRPASESDYIGLIYPGRRGWTYEITAYDKDEEQYMLNIGITAIYKDEEHSDSQCENAYLEVYIPWRARLPLWLQITSSRIKERIETHLQRLTGEGITTVESNTNSKASETLITTGIGRNVMVVEHEGLHRIASYVHMNKTHPLEDNTSIREGAWDGPILYPLDSKPVRVEEPLPIAPPHLNLEPPKRKLPRRETIPADRGESSFHWDSRISQSKRRNETA